MMSNFCVNFFWGKNLDGCIAKLKNTSVKKKQVITFATVRFIHLVNGQERTDNCMILITCVSSPSLPISLSVPLSLSLLLYFYLSPSHFFSIFIYLHFICISTSIYLSIYLSLYLSIPTYLIIDLFIYLPCLSLCPSLSFSHSPFSPYLTILFVQKRLLKCLSDRRSVPSSLPSPDFYLSLIFFLFLTIFVIICL